MRRLEKGFQYGPDAFTKWIRALFYYEDTPDQKQGLRTIFKTRHGKWDAPLGSPYYVQMLVWKKLSGLSRAAFKAVANAKNSGCFVPTTY